jgi:hypothetical protein
MDALSKSTPVFRTANSVVTVNQDPLDARVRAFATRILNTLWIIGPAIIIHATVSSTAATMATHSVSCRTIFWRYTPIANMANARIACVGTRRLHILADWKVECRIYHTTILFEDATLMQRSDDESRSERNVADTRRQDSAGVDNQLSIDVYP